MKNYRVKMHYSEYYFANIEAENYEAALDKSKLIQMEDCEKDEYTDWLVLDVNEIELSKSDLAFICAYSEAIGIAPRSIVKIWLQTKNKDKFSEEYFDYAASISWAYEMWQMGQRFNKWESK